MTHTTRLQARYNEKGEYLFFVYGYKADHEPQASNSGSVSASASNFLAGMGWFKRIIFVLTF